MGALGLVAGLLAVALAVMVGPAGAAEYGYEDNVSGFLASGKKAFETGRLDEAEVELENLILVAPGHAGGHELLFEVYVKQGRAGLARKLLDRMVEGRLLDSAALAALEGRIPADGQAADPGRGSLWDGPPPPLPAPGAAQPARSRVATAVDRSSPEAGDEDLDDLLGELGGDDPAPGPGPDQALAPAPPPPPPPPAGENPPDAKSPQALHAYAVSLFKRTGSAEKAGRLLVQAMEAAPELLAEPDGGLFDATYEVFKGKLASDPKSQDTRFVMAFLEEKRGEDDKAVGLYESIAADAPAGDRMGTASKARAELLKAETVRKEAEKQKQMAELARKKERDQLPEIEKGVHPDLKTPAEFEAKGVEVWRRWQTTKSPEDLETARVYLKGAIAKAPDNAEFRYKLALVRLDEATEGVAGARDDAKAELERVLTLNPPAQVKIDAESLLKGMVSAASTTPAPPPPPPKPAPEDGDGSAAADPAAGDGTGDAGAAGEGKAEAPDSGAAPAPASGEGGMGQ